LNCQCTTRNYSYADILRQPLMTSSSECAMQCAQRCIDRKICWECMKSFLLIPTTKTLSFKAVSTSFTSSYSYSSIWSKSICICSHERWRSSILLLSVVSPNSISMSTVRSQSKFFKVLESGKGALDSHSLRRIGRKFNIKCSYYVASPVRTNSKDPKTKILTPVRHFHIHEFFCNCLIIPRLNLATSTADFNSLTKNIDCQYV
jgi:hypothetical protein